MDSSASAFEQANRAQIREMLADEDLHGKTLDWLRHSAQYEYSYHFTWLGLPIIQYPADILAVQEIIWTVQPDLIVETGIARGGSLVLSASILQLIGRPGIVLGIDIDIRKPNRAAIEGHPLAHRIRMIEGSSTATKVVEQVRDLAAGAKQVIVLLDSNHTHDHVLRELELYSPLVSPGGYVVVFDTAIEQMPTGSFPDRPWDKGDNPGTAVKAFLDQNDRFEVDHDLEDKLLITVAPGGYLKCVKAPA
jgi:cephalosporin hydroxylase